MQRIELVDFSPTLRRLLIHCEVNCTVDCCHTLAFDISCNRIAQWFDGERIDRTNILQNEIRQMLSTLMNTGPIVELSARGLESKWPSDELKEFFEVLLQAIQAIRQTNK